MGIDFVCAQNVQHFKTARFEVIRDKRTVATPPHGFRTHDCGRTGSSGYVKQSLDSFFKLLRLHVIRISAEGRVAPCSIARVRFGFSLAAQLWKMFVTDSARVQ